MIIRVYFNKIGCRRVWGFKLSKELLLNENKLHFIFRSEEKYIYLLKCIVGNIFKQKQFLIEQF